MASQFRVKRGLVAPIRNPDGELRVIAYFNGYECKLPSVGLAVSNQL